MSLATALAARLPAPPLPHAAAVAAPPTPRLVAPKPPHLRVVAPVPPPVHPAVAAAGAAAAPMASLTPTQFANAQAAKAVSSYQQYTNYLNTQMGRIDMNSIDAQANAALTSQTQPLLDQNAALLKQEQAGITGFTSTLASRLAAIGPAVQSIYQQAEQQQGALDTSLSQDLSGAIGTQADQMGALLSARGQDTSPAAQAAAAGIGAGQASYATGSASLAALLQGGAAASAYATGLPGIAALQGMQALGQANAQSATNASTILSNAQQQFPGLVNTILSQTEAGQQKSLDALYKAASLAESEAKNSSSVVVQQQKLAQAKQLAQIADAIRQESVNNSSANAATSRGRLAYTEAPKYSASVSRSLGYRADQYGNPVGGKVTPLPGFALKGGKVVKVGTSKTFTPAETVKYTGQAAQMAASVAAGTVNPTTGRPYTYSEAIGEAVKMGIPTSIFVQQLNKAGVYNSTPTGRGGMSVPARVGTTMRQNGVTYQWNGHDWNPIS